MFTALAKFERGLIRERALAGGLSLVLEVEPVIGSQHWTSSRFVKLGYCYAI